MGHQEDVGATTRMQGPPGGCRWHKEDIEAHKEAVEAARRPWGAV